MMMMMIKKKQDCHFSAHKNTLCSLYLTVWSVLEISYSRSKLFDSGLYFSVHYALIVHIFSSNVDGMVVDHARRFPIVDILIRSGDIRDQSSYSKSRFEFWTFLALPNFTGRGWVAGFLTIIS